MRAVAIIPTKIQTHLYNKLINTLYRSSIISVNVLNNGDRVLPELPVLGFHEKRTVGYSIYEMWNIGFEFGDSLGQHTLMLNDDIEFEPHLVSVLSMYLERDPTLGIVFPDYDTAIDTGEYSLRYTDTTAGAGGMAGFCFMVRAGLGIRVDENLKLYWGDDDLVKQVIAKGYKIARVVGLPVLHAGSYTINRMDANERRNLMEADRAYFNAKYGENRGPV